MPITPSSAIPTDPSPQLAAALKLATAISDADFTLLAEAVTDDYVQVVFPSTVGIPPVNGKNAIIEIYKGILPNLGSYEVRLRLGSFIIQLISQSGHVARYN